MENNYKYYPLYLLNDKFGWCKYNMYRDKLYKGRRQSKKKSAIIIKWPNSSRKATQLWDTDDVPDLDGDDGLDDGGRDTPLQEARA